MVTKFLIQLARGFSHLQGSLQLQVQVSCAALLLLSQAVHLSGMLCLLCNQLLTAFLRLSRETVAFSLMLSKTLKTGLLILLQLMSHELLMLFRQLSQRLLMLSRQPCKLVFMVSLHNTMTVVIFGVSGMADVSIGSMDCQAFAATYWITRQAKMILKVHYRTIDSTCRIRCVVYSTLRWKLRIRRLMQTRSNPSDPCKSVAHRVADSYLRVPVLQAACLHFGHVSLLLCQLRVQLLLTLRLRLCESSL